MFRIILTVILILLSSLSLATANSNLKYDLGTAGGWFPYHSLPQFSRPGVFEAINNQIALRTKISFEGIRFPPKRTESAMNNGLIDLDFICLEWFHDQRNDDSKFILSDPIIYIDEYYVTKPGNNKLFPTRESAAGKPIGTIAGYFYHNDHLFTRVDFLNEGQLILGLDRNRFEAIILERETAVFWGKKMNVPIEFAARHSRGQLRMRLQKKHAHLLPEINSAIATIKSDGSLLNLLQSRRVASEIVK